MKHRFHVIGLPWTRTNDDHITCAYTQKCVKFSRMMLDRGHEVFLYSGINNTAPCTEHIVAITPEEQADILGTTQAPWNRDHPAWVAMNMRAAYEIARRSKAGSHDFLCLITSVQEPIAQALPWLQAVEFGIGYPGTFANFRVFESHAWRHTIYGKDQGTDWEGRWYDAVIPNYFDPDDFFVRPPSTPPYFLYVGRGIWRKGTQIAADVAQHLGVDLVLAGQEIEGWPTYGLKVGPVGPVERAGLMSGATALFAPTTYGGPFEGVVVESLLSGTPVITTDFGAFCETVQPGDGWRCNTMAEFVDAGRAALAEADEPVDSDSNLQWLPDVVKPLFLSNRTLRRERAIARYSLEAVAPRYERYFDRVHELWGEGWPAREHLTHPG